MNKQEAIWIIMSAAKRMASLTSKGKTIDFNNEHEEDYSVRLFDAINFLEENHPKEFFSPITTIK